MTPELTQWVNEQAEPHGKEKHPMLTEEEYYKDYREESYYDYTGDIFLRQVDSRHSFTSGLTRGIEIAVGFIEWIHDNYLLVHIYWIELGTPGKKLYTTSELLLIYLKTIEK